MLHNYLFLNLQSGQNLGKANAYLYKVVMLSVRLCAQFKILVLTAIFQICEAVSPPYPITADGKCAQA